MSAAKPPMCRCGHTRDSHQVEVLCFGCAGDLPCDTSAADAFALGASPNGKAAAYIAGRRNGLHAAVARLEKVAAPNGAFFKDFVLEVLRQEAGDDA